MFDIQFGDDELFNALAPAEIQPERAFVSFSDQLESEKGAARALPGDKL